MRKKCSKVSSIFEYTALYMLGLHRRVAESPERGGGDGAAPAFAPALARHERDPRVPRRGDARAAVRHSAGILISGVSHPKSDELFAEQLVNYNERMSACVDIESCICFLSLLVLKLLFGIDGS